MCWVVITADPLIGRADELVVVDDFLARLTDGAHALLIEGEPGIGKTRLWQEGVAHTRDRGYRILAARPGGSEVQLAFAGLSDLLAPVLDDVLPALPAPQRRALQVALLLRDAEGVSPDQRAVSAAFLGAVRALALETASVIAVDDLQWLDRASASVLSFAMRRLESERVGLLATVRVPSDASPLTEIAEGLEGRLTRVPLGPMSVSALYELCRTRLDLALQRPLLLRVHETSGGRPLLALELARALRDADHEIDRDEPLPVPHDLRNLLIDRLGRLPDSARETLLVAAAAPQPTLELLALATTDVAEGGVRAALEAGVVELDGRDVRFTHPLFASVHYERSPRSLQREVHRRLAELSVDPEEHARHLALAADRPKERVAIALETAAGAAEARGAVPAAAELATRAVQLTPERLGARLHRRRLDAARLTFAAGDRPGAECLLEEALADARSGDERAETLLELGRVRGAEELGAALVLLREAAAEDKSDPRLRAAVLVALAPREGYSGAGYDRAAEIAREAVELAEEAGDDTVLAEALSMLGYLELMRGRRFAHDLMRRAEALEGANGLTVDGPTETYGEMLAWCGEHAAARERLERVIALGHEIDDSGICRPLFRLGYTEFEAGQWDRAWELGMEAKEVAAQSGREATAPLGDVILSLVEAMRGDVEAGRARGLAALEATERAGRHSGGPRGALALIELSCERYREAFDVLEPYFARIRGLGADLPESEISDAVEALAHLGRLDEARTYLESFEEVAHRLDLTWAIAAAARCRGLVAAAANDADSAEAWLEQAVARGENAAMPLELGRSLLALGAVRRRTRKKAAAREALDGALTIFEHLGASVWAERVRRELGRIGGRATPRSALSETEERIAELVATGCSNKEVARALHLSPRTVEWNLSKIYRKLGVHSRTGLAASRGARR
jgi:DNA-binding CsgD family transcriptional regulator